MTDPAAPSRPALPDPAASGGPLDGFRVGVTAARKVEEQVTLLERRGARVDVASVLAQQPTEVVEDDLRRATQEVLAGPVDVLVATTGIGMRTWARSAAGWGVREDLLARLRGAELLARGPKSVGALRGLGLREDWSAASEELDEVLAHLGRRDLHGVRVVVQEHGQSLSDVGVRLREQGADVVTVPVYRVVPAEDTGPVRTLVDLVADRVSDAVTFTSAPAVAAFLDVADEADRLADVLDALRHDVLAACVGPVTAAALDLHDVPSSRPERSRLAAMVTQLERDLAGRRALRTDGHGS